MKNKVTAPGDKLPWKNENLKSNIFCAIVSGVLLVLSFPKYGSGFIAWFALIPLLYALHRTASIRQALLLGFITGIIGYIGIIYWIIYVVVNYGYLPVYLGITLMLLLACYLSVYPAIFAAGIAYFRNKIPLHLTSPVLWVCLEYCKSQLFTGFPWENLGYSQYLNLYVIQIADISGVYGLSFLIVLVNAALFEIIAKRSKREFIMASAVSLILISVYTYGIYRVNSIDKILQNPATPSMEVALIQGNIDQAMKWNENYQKETINIYEDVSLKNAPASGGLIVWPETAAPFNFQDDSALSRQIRNLAVKTKSNLVFGTISYLRSSHSVDFYNSAYLLSSAGEVKGRYDKVHLVPYGEYVPLRNVFPFVKKLTAGIGDFSTGDGYYPLSASEQKIGVLICYEGILPFAARMYKNESAEVLVNITNDAWFGSTSAPYQHLSMTIFRAVETRLYLVRAANTGISAIVDPKGQIVAKTGIFQKDAINGHVKLLKVPTFYAQYGDLLAGICFMLCIMFLLWVLKGRLKNAGRKHSGKN